MNATYDAAGVEIAAGERAVELMKASVSRARRLEVMSDLGGFAGLFRADALKSYERPVLATSTDGVGTKVAVAQMLDKHDTIGFDLVGMVVDDLVVCGAEPLFLTDYIACGKLIPERIATIVRGIADACVAAGCALIGGETAEHPGLLEPHEYDLAGAATGVVDEPNLLGPQRVRTGDAIIAMGSTGLHANGYALARHVFFTLAGWPVDRSVPELGRAIGEELLEPTRIYAVDCLALAAAVEVHAMAHVTGGGLPGNLARALPADCDAVVDRSTWTPGPIFTLLQSQGRVAQPELERTFNMGVGMVALVRDADADQSIRMLSDRGLPAWVAGEIVRGSGQVRLVNTHA